MPSTLGSNSEILAAVRDGIPLPGGQENDVYRATLDGVEVAVRVCAPWIGIDRVAYEHEITSAMAARIDAVPRPLLPPFETDGRAVSATEFRNGTQMSRDDDRSRSAAARLLAEIHRVGLELEIAIAPALQPLNQLDWERNPMWDLERIQQTLAEMRRSDHAPARELAASADRLEDERHWAAGRTWPAPSGIVHGDYWPGNLLAVDGSITAALDWLEARRDSLSFELGRAVWEFCSDREEHTLLTDRADAFLEAYLDAGGPARETDDLVDAMRISVLIDVLRDLTYEYERLEETADYHLGSLRRLDHLAEVTWP